MTTVWVFDPRLFLTFSKIDRCGTISLFDFLLRQFWGDFDALHLKRIRIQYLNPKPIQKVRKKAGKRSQNHKNATFQIQQGNRILENGR